LTVPIYSINNNKIEEQLQKYIFKKFFNFYEYNKSVILAYENGLFAYKDNYQYFINQQIEYLKTLHIVNLKSIRDYINDIVSKKYIIPYNNKKPINLNDINTRNIGDAFSYFVALYLTRNTYLKPHLTRIYEKDTENNLIIDFINKYKSNNLPQNKETCHAVYYQVLNNDDWQIILKWYYDNLNLIIMNAPPIEENRQLFVYRGANNNYLKDELTISNPEEINKKEYIFNSARISSYSINYEASKYFYNSAEIPVMLRVLIEKGSRVLFITPFASNDALYYEMEILTSSIQLVKTIDNKFEIKDAYNNINNTNCLSLDNKDKINSYNTITIYPEYSSMILHDDNNVKLPFNYKKTKDEKINLEIQKIITEANLKTETGIIKATPTTLLTERDMLKSLNPQPVIFTT